MAIRPALWSGSSPLARGTRRCRGFRGLAHRFIPAGAGNTCVCCGPVVQGAVHPRWRGEHGQLIHPHLDHPGSSPLARGTRPLFFRPGAGLRFIPAGAGNTWGSDSTAEVHPVHPRWRGEHFSGMPRATRLRGSSPLARGTLHPRCAERATDRFIPAGAGNT